MGRLIELVRDHPQQVNALVAIGAVLLSSLSIILTVTALWFQRRHYFKSLTPIAYISARDYENVLEVTLVNDGIGPLLVEKFVASFEGAEKENIIEWMPAGIVWSTFTKFISGRCIPAGKSVILVRFEGNPDDAEFQRSRNSVRRTLSRLQVAVKYHDIYGRKMPDAQRALDWFARNLPDAEARDETPSIRATPSTHSGRIYEQGE
jgi:hypothetical protein